MWYGVEDSLVLIDVCLSKLKAHKASVSVFLVPVVSMIVHFRHGYNYCTVLYQMARSRV